MSDSSPGSPRILAIICNWNKKRDLRSLLLSLRGLEGPEFDVLVVDNASSDGSPEMVKREFPWAKLLETGANLGGTGGFNAGLEWGLASSENYEFLWLLDNDVELEEGVLEPLLRPMLRRENVGLTGSAILLPKPGTHVQEVGVRIDWKTGRFHLLGEGPLEKSRPPAFEAHYVASCSCLARARAVREAGLMDPAYFFFFDDMDWGVRIHRHGWRVLGIPASRVHHESFLDRRSRSGLRGFYIAARNQLYFFRKNAPAKQRPLILFRLLRRWYSLVANVTFEGRLDEAEAIRLGVGDFLRGRMGAPRPLDALKGLGVNKKKRMPRDERLRVKRVGLLARDNPDFAAKARAFLCKEFPSADVEVLVIGDSSQIAEAELPNRRDRNAHSVIDRLRLALLVGREYDVLVSPVFLQPFLFETAAPVVLRLDEQFHYRYHRRSLGRWLGMAWGAAGAYALALSATVRALLKSPSLFSTRSDA